jgi:hypothetical protein
MKVWLVLYIFGRLSAVWNYDPTVDFMGQCLVHAEQLNNTIEFRSPETHYTCITSDDTPAINSKIVDPQ